MKCLDQKSHAITNLEIHRRTISIPVARSANQARRSASGPAATSRLAGASDRNLKRLLGDPSADCLGSLRLVAVHDTTTFVVTPLLITPVALLALWAPRAELDHFSSGTSVSSTRQAA